MGWIRGVQIVVLAEDGRGRETNSMCSDIRIVKPIGCH